MTVKTETFQTPKNKAPWARPAVKRLEAGAAESNFSGASDGSGQQGIGS